MKVIIDVLRLARLLESKEFGWCKEGAQTIRDVVACLESKIRTEAYLENQVNILCTRVVVLEDGVPDGDEYDAVKFILTEYAERHRSAEASRRAFVVGGRLARADKLRKS